MVTKGRQISHGAAYSDYAAMKEKAVYIGGEHLDSDALIASGTPDLEDIWLEFKYEGSSYSKGGKDVKNTLIALEASPTSEELKSLGINSTEETLTKAQKEALFNLAKEQLDAMDGMEINYNYKVKVKQVDANGNVIRDANGKPVKKEKIKQGVVPKTHLRDSKWFCVLHRDSKSGIWHLHFVISRFRRSGEEMNDPRLIAKRAARASELVNQKHKWQSAERISTKHSAELKDTIYDVLRKMDKFSWEGFKEAMDARTFKDYKSKQQNYELMFRNDSKGNVVGYSVWRGNSNYNASKIGRQLTASRIVETWQKLHEQVAQVKISTKRWSEEWFRQRRQREKLKKQQLVKAKLQLKTQQKSESELERETSVRTTKFILKNFCQSIFNIFDREEVFEIKKGIIAKCINDGGHSWNESDMKIAADSFFEDFDEKNRQEVRAKDLFTEIVDLLLPIIQASAGGGGNNNNNLPKSKDDEWLWLHKNLFGMGPGRKR